MERAFDIPHIGERILWHLAEEDKRSLLVAVEHSSALHSLIITVRASLQKREQYHFWSQNHSNSYKTETSSLPLVLCIPARDVHHVHDVKMDRHGTLVLEEWKDIDFQEKTPRLRSLVIRHFDSIVGKVVNQERIPTGTASFVANDQNLLMTNMNKMTKNASIKEMSQEIFIVEIK
jgi:hypothetical protein